jgi:hypothetical protein
MNIYGIVIIVIVFGAIFIKFLHLIYEVVSDIWPRQPTAEEKRASHIKEVKNSCWLALQSGISYEEILDIINQEIIKDVHHS